MQRIQTSAPYQLIYSLGEHPYLGYLIEPHIVQLNNNGSLSLSYKRVFSNTVDEFASALDEIDYKIIRLLDQVEQTAVIKKFHKKAIRPADYFGKHFDSKVYDQIRPILETHLLKALALIGGKPLYLMNTKDGYPAQQRIRIAEHPTSILFHFRRNEEETRYFPTLKYDGNRMEFMFKNAAVIINSQAWLLLENKLYHFDQPLEGKKLSPFLNKRYITVSRATERKYFDTFVPNLIEKYHVYAEGFDIKTIKEEATPVLTLHYNPGGDSFLKLSFNYGNYNFSNATDQKVSVSLAYDEQKDWYTFTRIRRSNSWEQNKSILLENLGLRKQGALHGTYIPQVGNQHSVFEWLNQHQDYLVEQGFGIEQESGEKKFFIGKTALDFEVIEDNDWFDVRAFVHFGPYKVPFIELRDYILNRIQEYILPNGEIAILPEEWFAQYEHLFQFAVQKDSLLLNKAHIGLLHEISEHTALSMSRKLQNLSNFEQIAQTEPPIDFRGSLRSYQQAGYNWFHFLQEYKFGGVLADDMGLGKTVQTLALLQKQNEILKEDEHARTSLLVLPTSLVYNWQKEAEKFAPSLRLLIHTGSYRYKDPLAFANYDVVITTYGIVRSDENLFKQLDRKSVV